MLEAGTASEASGRGESEALRERHQNWYAELAERAATALVGPDMSDWIERLEAEIDNLHAAIDAATATAPETALRIGGSLSSFWITRGYVNRVQERLVSLLSHPETAAPTQPSTRPASSRSGTMRARYHR